MGVAGLATGCGEGVHSAGTMVKDPEPLPPEETTEAMLQSKAKTKKGRRR